MQNIKNTAMKYNRSSASTDSLQSLLNWKFFPIQHNIPPPRVTASKEMY